MGLALDWPVSVFWHMARPHLHLGRGQQPKWHPARAENRCNLLILKHIEFASEPQINFGPRHAIIGPGIFLWGADF